MTEKKTQPKSFNEFHRWIDKANGFPFKEIEEHQLEQPVWDSDCNFKLDFDGPIIHVSSRFYPPAKHYGPGWDGTVSIFLLGEEIKSQKFQCDDFDQLTTEVRTYVDNYILKLKEIITAT